MFPLTGKKAFPLLLLKIVAAGLFLYYISHIKNLTQDHFKWVWEHANPSFLVLSFIVAGIQLYLNVLRWHYFLKSGGFETSMKQSTASYMAGNLFGLVSPGRLAEFGRGYIYPKYDLKDTALVTLAEKFYFVFFTLVFGLLGFAFGYSYLIPLLAKPILFVIGVIFVLLLILSTWITLKGQALSFKGFFKYFPTKEPDRFFLLTLTNLTYILMVLQFYFILIAFFKIKLLYAFVTLSLTLVAITFFPISFGNLGVREACFIYLLEKSSGFPEIAALNAGFLIFIQNIFLPAAAGLVVILVSRRLSQKT